MNDTVTPWFLSHQVWTPTLRSVGHEISCFLKGSGLVNVPRSISIRTISHHSSWAKKNGGTRQFCLLVRYQIIFPTEKLPTSLREATVKLLEASKDLKRPEPECFADKRCCGKALFFEPNKHWGCIYIIVISCIFMYIYIYILYYIDSLDVLDTYF